MGAMLVMAVAGGRRFPLVNRVVAMGVLPLEDGLNALLHGGDEAREFWRALTELRTKNRQLTEENQALHSAYIDMVALKKENAILRRLLDYKEANRSRKYVAAKVVAKNFGDLRDVVYINAGRGSGVAVDNAVLTEKGLVGIVDEVYDDYARVLLLTSTNCRVGARVVHTGFDSSGIVYGVHETENIVAMEHIPRDAVVAEGDLVVTNGYSGKHPENILIGKLSPGIMITDFLTSSMGKDGNNQLSDRVKKVYNILGDYPDVIAEFLTRKMIANKKNDVRIEWLTNAKAAGRFMTAGFKKRDFFSK